MNVRIPVKIRHRNRAVAVPEGIILKKAHSENGFPVRKNQSFCVAEKGVSQQKFRFRCKNAVRSGLFVPGSRGCMI